MQITKRQYDNLPEEYKQYFVQKGGDASSDGHIMKNVHPT